MNNDNNLKSDVHDFWNAGSCGEVYATGETEKESYENQGKSRYQIEPYIHDFANFCEGLDKDVLEVGLGMGADHIEWARAKPRTLTGIDLTPKSIEHTRKRLKLFNLESFINVGDAENLSFEQNSFDIVYSYGVLHHSPNTQKAFKEVHRVLRPNGVGRFMIYHTKSLTGYMLWFRYGLLAGKPFRSLRDIYAEHLESPGTKAFSVSEAEDLCSMYSEVTIKIQLSLGDLLEGEVGQRHRGMFLTIAKKIWPRWLIRKLFKNNGLFLLIEAKK
jgi:ubiquinone/menaquinone biosynthesis C-methylase UbiE